MSLTFTDIFCGAGGSSIGLTGAGMELKLAANHWDRAIETHAANFRDAEHLCADVNNYDMRRLPRTDVLWASPICTEISPAGGRRRRTRPMEGQGDLLEEFGPIASSAFDRTRATAFDVIRATEVHRYAAVIIENVVEFATDWELFGWWLDGMAKLGYNHQTVCVSSAHVGDEANPWAPQWRDRLYIVFTRDGIPLPDVAPRPVAWCNACDAVVRSQQWWKNPHGPRLGKYRTQYVYGCPVQGHAAVEPYVMPASSIIDWSDLGARIGDRGRPLAARTTQRIEAGLRMFARPPLLIRACGTDPEDSEHVRAWPADRVPVGTRMTSNSDGIVSPPMLVPAGGPNTTPYLASDPMRTRLARADDAVVTPPFVVNANHDDDRQFPVDRAPLSTRSTKIGDGVVTPFVAMLRNNATATDIRHPVATLAAGGNHHALVVPYRRAAKPTTTDDPLHTLSTRDSAALVQAAVRVDDCHFRMLKPREHLRAQRFGDDYIVTGNQGEQTMQAGNAVSANVAHWLGRQVMAALDSRGVA